MAGFPPRLTEYPPNTLAVSLEGREATIYAESTRVESFIFQAKIAQLTLF